MAFELFAIEFCMFLGTDDHHGYTSGVGLHHDRDRHGGLQAGNGHQENFDHMLHGVMGVIVQENLVLGCGFLFDLGLGFVQDFRTHRSNLDAGPLGCILTFRKKTRP